jgi:hypothetical protein
MFCQIGVFSSVNWWDLYERMFYVWDILFFSEQLAGFSFQGNQSFEPF